MRSDLAVKLLSLISINSKQVSKICSMVKCSSHPMHIGGSSPFNKKEWVRKGWPMCNRAITVSSFLFFQGQDIHSFNTGNILYKCGRARKRHRQRLIVRWRKGDRDRQMMRDTETDKREREIEAERQMEREKDRDRWRVRKIETDGEWER